ncbi:Uncharacterised protein [Mycobacteroides abscessus subsp. abscessus]|nr:Uncharacterised protein [Mycobacteroides abscessus subsp. abscessus]
MLVDVVEEPEGEVARDTEDGVDAEIGETVEEVVGNGVGTRDVHVRAFRHRRGAPCGSFWKR